MQLMKNMIDQGFPLIISVDPRYLPEHDYDILRAHNSTGGAHGVVIVGYNDTEGAARIVDPGVGSFGDNFSYPTDGRGNYTKISYTSLALAWGSREWISISLIPSGTAVQDIPSRLGPYVRDRLLGSSSSYAPGSPYGYIWGFGQDAWRRISSDMTPDGLSSYLRVFNGIPNEVQNKALLLLFIGLGLEAQTTLQYVSFKAALEKFSSFMTGVELTSFDTEAGKALPHFEALADNRSLINPFDIAPHEGIVSSTFHNVIDAYNSTGNLTSSLALGALNFSIISQHLLGIADSWKAAGLVLDSIWPTNPLVVYAPFIIIGAIGGVVLAIVVIRWIRKKPSQ
jgi:hypothetical protein